MLGVGWLGKDSVGIMGGAGTPPLFTEAAFCVASVACRVAVTSK